MSESLSPGALVRDPGGDPAGGASRTARWRSDVAFQFQNRYRVVWVAVAALLVVAAISASDLYTTQSLLFVTALAGVLAVAAAGQLLVVMSGGIDLSVASVMTLAGAMTVKVSDGSNGRLATTIVVTLAVALGIGLVNGLLVAVAKLNALIVTLAVGGIVAGATILWAGTQFSATGAVPDSLARFAARHVGFFSVVAALGVALLLVLGLVLRSTAVGRGYVATGTNRVAAEIIGVRVRAQQAGGYAVAAVLYAAAGIVLAGLLQTPDITLGAPYLLSTIVAVALGGASLAGGPASMASTATGCFFVVFLNQYLEIENFGAGVKQLADGVALVAAVALVTAGAGGRWRILASRARLSRRRRAGDRPGSAR